MVDVYYDPDPKTPNKIYGKRGSFISGVPFDPVEFGIPPVALDDTDMAQLLALIVAEWVLSTRIAEQSVPATSGSA